MLKVVIVIRTYFQKCQTKAKIASRNARWAYETVMSPGFAFKPHEISRYVTVHCFSQNSNNKHITTRGAVV